MKNHDFSQQILFLLCVMLTLAMEYSSQNQITLQQLRQSVTYSTFLHHHTPLMIHYLIHKTEVFSRHFHCMFYPHLTLISQHHHTIFHMSIMVTVLQYTIICKKPLKIKVFHILALYSLCSFSSVILSATCFTLSKRFFLIYNTTIIAINNHKKL